MYGVAIKGPFSAHGVGPCTISRMLKDVIAGEWRKLKCERSKIQGRLGAQACHVDVVLRQISDGLLIQSGTCIGKIDW